MDAGDFLSILLLGGNGWLARYKFVKMCPFLSLCTLHHINYFYKASDQGRGERELRQGRACLISLRTHVNYQNTPPNSKNCGILVTSMLWRWRQVYPWGLNGQKPSLLVEF